MTRPRVPRGAAMTVVGPNSVGVSGCCWEVSGEEVVCVCGAWLIKGSLQSIVGVYCGRRSGVEVEVVNSKLEGRVRGENWCIESGDRGI